MLSPDSGLRLAPPRVCRVRRCRNRAFHSRLTSNLRFCEDRSRNGPRRTRRAPAVATPPAADAEDMYSRTHEPGRYVFRCSAAVRWAGLATLRMCRTLDATRVGDVGSPW